MNHNEKPETNLSKAEIEKLEESKNEILKSDYYQEILTRFDFIDGRFVVDSISGDNGFILLFNQLFCVVALFENKLNLWIGNGEWNEEHIGLINSPLYGNGRNPQLGKNIPYSEEYCDMEKEIKNCHGMQIEGIAIGENSFNICFANDKELDMIVFEEESGKLALRVFWEQW